MLARREDMHFAGTTGTTAADDTSAENQRGQGAFETEAVTSQRCSSNNSPIFLPLVLESPLVF